MAYGVTNAPFFRPFMLPRYVEPGESLPITFQPSATTTNHSFAQAWSEE